MTAEDRALLAGLFPNWEEFGVTTLVPKLEHRSAKHSAIVLRSQITRLAVVLPGTSKIAINREPVLIGTPSKSCTSWRHPTCIESSPRAHIPRQGDRDHKPELLRGWLQRTALQAASRQPWRASRQAGARLSEDAISLAAALVALAHASFRYLKLQSTPSRPQLTAATTPIVANPPPTSAIGTQLIGFSLIWESNLLPCAFNSGLFCSNRYLPGLGSSFESSSKYFCLML